MADEDLKRRLESLLFSSGRRLDVAELAQLCKEDDVNKICDALKELQLELEQKQSSIMLIEEGDYWKFTVREKYLQYVKKVVKQSELPKSLLETLAVVAFKSPALQSQIIKIRTNKAYKHLDELEKSGYIVREKKGRTKLIKLTQKFFDYFDLPPDKLKEKFKNVAKLETVIETKEHEIEVQKEEQMKKIETYTPIERIDDPVPQPVEIINEKLGKLEVYDTTPAECEPKNIGNLEVYGDEKKHKKKKPAKKELKQEKSEEESVVVKEEKPEEILESAPEWSAEKKEPEPIKESKPSKGMFPEGVPADVEKKIDEIVKEITEPKPEEKEEEQQ